MISLTTWQFDPSVWLAAALALVGYAWLYGRSIGDRARAPWPAWQAASFLAGLAIVLLALESPLDGLAEGFFWAHMLQHMLLLVVAPPLLVLGVPAIALLRAVPRSVRQRLVRPVMRSRITHRARAFVLHPLAVAMAFNAILFAWHLPPLYRAADQQAVLHAFEHASYLFAGLMLWWLIIEPRRVWPKEADLPKIVFVVVAHLPMLLLGQVFLAFAAAPLYGPQTAQEVVWGLTALADQRVGGAIMVSMDVLITFATISILFGRYLARLEHRQRLLEELSA